MEGGDRGGTIKHHKEEEGQEVGEEERGIDTTRSQQQVWSWGAGTDGQLGTGKLEDECLPRLLPYSFLHQSISSLSCGGAHVIAFTSGGKVMTWGRGTSGQLGHADMLNCLYPKIVDSLDGHLITHVSAGWSHSGFVSDAGLLFTCGDGSFGQLGHGDCHSHSTPLKVSHFEGKHVEQIACGMRHSLVLLKDLSCSQIYSFGSGKRGQLGLFMERVRSVCLPQYVHGIENVDIVSVNANGDHSAALSADGHLYKWGRGFNGNSDENFPQHLVSSLRFSRVALGWNHALLLTAEGEVFMLGGSHHGALSSLDRGSPDKKVEDLGEAVLIRVFNSSSTIAHIAAGAEHSAIVTENGEIKTWGWGEHGQLGLGDTSDKTDPQVVRLPEKVDVEGEMLNVYCGSGFTYAIRLFSRAPDIL